MSEQTQAASSPAEQEDVFGSGNDWTFDEASRYRKDGEVPERFKAAPAESAPVDAPEKTVESEGDEPESEPDSEPEEAQEQPPKGSGAEKRIKQLLARVKELERAAQAPKQDVKPESSTAQSQPPQNYQEWRKGFKAADWNKQYLASNPEATWEDIEDARADHLADAREFFRKREEQANARNQAWAEKTSEARNRYGEVFDDVVNPVSAELLADRQIPDWLKRMIVKSEVPADLVFTLGEDAKAKAEFFRLARTDPEEAARYVVRLEHGIEEQLSKEKEATPARGEDGKFQKAPESKKTQAPRPPSRVESGGSSRAFDVSDESLSADAWMVQRNAQVAKQGR